MTIEYVLSLLKSREYSDDSKLFASNVGGFATSEYPIIDSKIVAVHPDRLGRKPWGLTTRNDGMIDILLLTESMDIINSFDKCLTMKTFIDVMNNAVDKNLIVCTVTERDEVENGWICPIINMYDGHGFDCRESSTLEIYGDDIFQLWI